MAGFGRNIMEPEEGDKLNPAPQNLVPPPAGQAEDPRIARLNSLLQSYGNTAASRKKESEQAMNDNRVTAEDRAEVDKAASFRNLLSGLQSSADKFGSVGGKVADSSGFAKNMQDANAIDRQSLNDKQSAYKQASNDFEGALGMERNAATMPFEIDELKSKSDKRIADTEQDKQARDPNSDLSKRTRLLMQKSFPRVAQNGGISENMSAADLNEVKAQFAQLETNANSKDIQVQLAKMQIDASSREKQLDREAAATSDRLKLENKPAVVPTEGERSAAYYAYRIGKAEENFDKISAMGYKPQAGYASFERAVLPNLGKSTPAQLQAQAERNFINAILRRESGAVISQPEFESAELQYLPRLGDDPETVAQKKENRREALIGIKNAAGRATIGEDSPIVGDVTSGNSSSTASRPVWQNPNRRVGVKP